MGHYEQREIPGAAKLKSKVSLSLDLAHNHAIAAQDKTNDLLDFHSSRIGSDFNRTNDMQRSVNNAVALSDELLQTLKQARHCLEEVKTTREVWVEDSDDAIH